MTLIPIEPSTDHISGLPSAGVTLVEYGDFECPNCRQAYPAVKVMRAHFGDKLRFVFRHFPQSEIHPHAIAAAEAAEAAAAQRKFWEYHDLLFMHAPLVSVDTLLDYAWQVGLDMIRFKQDFTSQVYRDRVQRDLSTGIQAGVRATPTFFVNEKLADTSFGYQALHAVIDKEAAKL